MLIDLETDEVYLGDVNPRIFGPSSMTNVNGGFPRLARVTHEDRASSCAWTGRGDYRCKGADLGHLITKGRTDRRGPHRSGFGATSGIRGKYVSESVEQPRPSSPLPYLK